MEMGRLRSGGVQVMHGWRPAEPLGLYTDGGRQSLWASTQHCCTRPAVLCSVPWLAGRGAGGWLAPAALAERRVVVAPYAPVFRCIGSTRARSPSPHLQSSKFLSVKDSLQSAAGAGQGALGRHSSTRLTARPPHCRCVAAPARLRSCQAG